VLRAVQAMRDIQSKSSKKDVGAQRGSNKVRGRERHACVHAHSSAYSLFPQRGTIQAFFTRSIFVASRFPRILPTRMCLDSPALGVMTMCPVLEKVYNKGSLGSLASSLSDNYGSKVAARIKAEAPPSTPSSSRSGAPTTPGGGYVTPMKRKVPETPSSAFGGGSRMRALPSTPQTDMAMQESSPEAASFHKREQRLKVHSTFNEALPASLGSAVPRPSGARVEISAVQVARPEHYMYDRVENKVNMLKDRLKDVVDGIVANARLKENAGEEGFSFTPVNAASQERVWCCGRVVAEGDAASLNATSVMIEGANGRRVKLDMSNVPEFAMFPGQIIVVNGHNSTGQLIKVLSIYYDASLPMPKTPASQIALFNETDAYLGGNPLSVFTAAGPFTTSADLSYKPLDELLEHIVAESPDVVILCGPFVDCKHRLLDPNCAGQPGGFSNGTPPDTTTIMRTLMRDRISKALQGTHITCIIVPSPNDIHARPLFPQPAFSPEVIKGDGASDRDPPVVLMSNPCTFKINEVVVQVATQDVLVHMSGSEASKMTGDRMSRLGRHLIQQRSIYPLFPYAEGAQISAMLADGLTLPCSPDVLLVPSNLVPFAKRCGETLLLNPGLFHTHSSSTLLMVMVMVMVHGCMYFPGDAGRRSTSAFACSWILIFVPSIHPRSTPHTCLWTCTSMFCRQLVGY
jgi:DNA polymerase alpha subunit B